MTTDPQNTLTKATAIEFKSNTFTVPVLVISSNDLDVINDQIQKKIQIAPDFFKNSPIVLDVQSINKNNLPIDFTKLTNVLREAGLLPIGIRGGNGLQNKIAIDLGIPIHSVHNSPVIEKKNLEDSPPKIKSSHSETALNTQATLISQPVRSGQRIYATGDLIILAQVSAGAEIMAEGNIHVYNTLRGRALAGVQGNLGARIFCSDLQAELISIAGTYQISEDMRGIVRNKPVQIYLQEHTLIIKDTA
ncbi:MAG: septum site-determining protein MinC [Methylovulum sp.]|uniref:septum site-determining protein MinC n=1 Tax=Methylovulum sp. TaxID=1916980 RepID=UPI0026367957|nr:septum site-determining protein MinC [Methylovulum sp.]MDD2724081.1 septum site-determining protein MinC [Methylovulum sp.]MDD5123812.1 septum site-determining protein MinC [Methylovulum sp.]